MNEAIYFYQKCISSFYYKGASLLVYIYISHLSPPFYTAAKVFSRLLPIPRGLSPNGRFTESSSFNPSQHEIAAFVRDSDGGVCAVCAFSRF